MNNKCCVQLFGFTSVRWFVICRELVVPVPMIHDPKKGIIPVFYP